MKVLVTGSSGDIGKAIVKRFVSSGHQVIGIDKQGSPFTLDGYTHITADLTASLPDMDGLEVIVACHGVQLPDEETIEVNLSSTIDLLEKYALQPAIKAVVTIASASGRNGAEFPRYAASKGGLIAYTKNLALRLATFGATANSISPGGVVTRSNAVVVDDPKLYREVLDESLLGKWCDPDEIAEWVYFVAVVNKSMTGEDLLIDNGEMLKSNFVWPR